MIQSLMTRARSSILARGAAQLAASQMAVSAFAFAQTLVLTYVMTRTEFGAYRFIIAASNIVVALTLTGYATALVREAARGRSALAAGFRTVLRWSLGASVGAGLAGAYYFAEGNRMLGSALLLIAVIAPLRAGWELTPSFLSGWKRYAAAAVVLATPNALMLIACTVTALVYPNALAVATAYLISATAGAAIGYAYATSTSPAETAEPETLPYAKHLTLMNGVLIVAAQVDRVLVFHYLGAAELALYSVALGFPDQFRALAKVIPNVLLGRFSSAGMKGVPYRTYFLCALGFGTLAAIGYILVAPLLVPLFFPGYADAVAYSQVLALALPAAALYVPTSWLQAHRKTRSLYGVNVANAALQLVGTFGGLLAGGLWGLVVGRVVALLASILVTEGARLAASGRYAFLKTNP